MLLVSGGIFAKTVLDLLPRFAPFGIVKVDFHEFLMFERFA